SSGSLPCSWENSAGSLLRQGTSDWAAAYRAGPSSSTRAAERTVVMTGSVLDERHHDALIALDEPEHVGPGGQLVHVGGETMPTGREGAGMEGHHLAARQIGEVHHGRTMVLGVEHHGHLVVGRV